MFLFRSVFLIREYLCKGLCPIFPTALGQVGTGLLNDYVVPSSAKLVLRHGKAKCTVLWLARDQGTKICVTYV